MPKLNTANVDKIIKAIQNEDNFFDMSEYYMTTLNFEGLDNYNTEVSDPESGCGTAACIAGWANQIRLEESDKKLIHLAQLNDEESAQEWLGIDKYVGRDLFLVSHDGQRYRPDNPNYSLGEDTEHRNIDDITRQHAIAVLENLKATGIVDWSEKI